MSWVMSSPSSHTRWSIIGEWNLCSNRIYNRTDRGEDKQDQDLL